MSKRAILISILFVILLTTIGFINDWVLFLEPVGNGHQLPIIVIGTLFLFALLLNPLLGKWNRKRMFQSAELAVIVCICSCACGIGGRSLMEHFAHIVTLPHHWVQTNAGWKQREVLKGYPEGSLVTPDPYDEVVTRFITGTDQNLGQDASWLEKNLVKVTSVPWRQWLPPFKTWFPFILFVNLAMTAMAVIVHRQWSTHEHLQYPLANFMDTLVEHRPDHLMPDIFHSRFFWVGFVAVFLLRLNNSLQVWYPDVFIPVELRHSLHAFADKYPILRQAVSWDATLTFNIIPFATAIAFFLSSEISLSLGISNFIFGAITIALVSYGVEVNTDYDIGGYVAWSRGGGYIAYTLLLIYSGRFYYWNLLRDALFLPRLLPWMRRKPATAPEAKHDGAPAASVDSQVPVPKVVDTSASTVNAMRVFLISVVALCLLSIRLGLSWPIAILNIILMLVSFLIVARISTETGLPFIQPGWQPFAILMALFGSFAMGPTAILISALICDVLCIDQAMALMPYLSNGLKLAENNHISVPKLANVNFWIYLGGCVVCILFGIIVIYDNGTPAWYDWSFSRIPTLPIRASTPVALKLEAMDSLVASESLTGWQQLVNMQPKPLFLWAFGLGLFGVLFCQYMRMHTTWWWLHPVFILGWGNYPMSQFAIPMLTGWLIKKLCLRFGGYNLVKKLKPAAYGVIAAEITCALVFMIVGFIYHFFTDQYPKSYHYFPR